MGRVTVPILLECLEDIYRAARGEIAADQIRRVEVDDALVDTGATGLSLPRPMIAQLGLMPIRARQAMTSMGRITVNTFGAVRLTIQGRDCICDVAELPDEVPVLVGQVPLELLDFVVDLGQRVLIGNPAHGGQHVIELY